MKGRGTGPRLADSPPGWGVVLFVSGAPASRRGAHGGAWVGFLRGDARGGEGTAARLGV